MGGRMSSRIRIYNDAGCRTVQEGSVPDMGKYLNTGKGVVLSIILYLFFENVQYSQPGDIYPILYLKIIIYGQECWFGVRNFIISKNPYYGLELLLQCLKDEEVGIMP